MAGARLAANGLLAGYGIVGRLSAPLLRGLVYRRAARGKEDRTRLAERFGQASRPRPPGRLVWIHAASVGEALSALPLLDRLRAGFPDAGQLITTTTLTSARLLDSRLPAGALHQFIPFDCPPWVRSFLRHWRPDIGIFMESEIWPGLIHQASQTALPLALVNGRLSDRAAKNWSRAPFLAARLFGSFDPILAQSDRDAARIGRFAHPVTSCGNLRFAAAPLPVAADRLADWRARLAGRPLWLAASTHAGEEHIAVRTHRALKPETPDLLTVIAPRHTSRAGALADTLRLDGVSVARATGFDAATRPDILLVDRMGELGLWYRLARIVFVGGSLVPAGGHNPLEPARLDCALIAGPHMENQVLPVAALDARGGLVRVTNPATLTTAVAGLLRDPDRRNRLATAARNAITAEAGTLDRVFAALDPLLTRTLGRGRC